MEKQARMETPPTAFGGGSTTTTAAAATLPFRPRCSTTPATKSNDPNNPDNTNQSINSGAILPSSSFTSTASTTTENPNPRHSQAAPSPTTTETPAAAEDAMMLPRWYTTVKWDVSAPFRLQWINKLHCDDAHVSHLRNSMNEDLPPTRAKDGQEIAADVGWEMMRVLDREAVRLLDEAASAGGVAGGDGDEGNEDCERRRPDGERSSRGRGRGRYVGQVREEGDLFFDGEVARDVSKKNLAGRRLSRRDRGRDRGESVVVEVSSRAEDEEGHRDRHRRGGGRAYYGDEDGDYDG